MTNKIRDDFLEFIKTVYPENTTFSWSPTAHELLIVEKLDRMGAFYYPSVTVKTPGDTHDD